MNIIASTGREDIAIVYIAELSQGRLVEFVEALQPPAPREKKWVLLVSTMFGCPIGCNMCDAGGYYLGKPSKEEIFAQIDYLVRQRYPDAIIPSEQFKIQFARMGEPSLNMQVLDVLDELPQRYHAPGLMPSISSVAPAGSRKFFERLLEIKEQRYQHGHFQFQFSLHTTDIRLRDEIIPVKKWNFSEMAAYGERFYRPGDRKITLNFALAQGTTVEPSVLLDYFDPRIFLIKITPLNPTYRAAENRLESYIDPYQDEDRYTLTHDLRAAGYQVIVSIGEVEENYIGSNCGQYIKRHLEADRHIEDGYTYCLRETAE